MIIYYIDLFIFSSYNIFREYAQDSDFDSKLKTASIITILYLTIVLFFIRVQDVVPITLDSRIETYSFYFIGVLIFGSASMLLVWKRLKNKKMNRMLPFNRKNILYFTTVILSWLVFIFLAFNFSPINYN
jgi:uncharacterized membrane protein